MWFFIINVISLFRKKAKNELKSVRFADSAMIFEYTGNKVLIEYDNISEIFLFKIDVVGYDLIAIGFADLSSGVAYYVYEDPPYWEIATEGVKEKFGVDWLDSFKAVAFPAFEKCRTTIWQKEVKPDE